MNDWVFWKRILTCYGQLCPSTSTKNDEMRGRNANFHTTSWPPLEALTISVENWAYLNILKQKFLFRVWYCLKTSKSTPCATLKLIHEHSPYSFRDTGSCYKIHVHFIESMRISLASKLPLAIVSFWCILGTWGADISHCHISRFMFLNGTALVMMKLYLDTSVVVNTDHFSEAHVNTYI